MATLQTQHNYPVFAGRRWLVGLILTVIVQAAAYTLFPVFAPYELFCSAPYGFRLGCTYIILASPQTALQLLSKDQLLPIALLFLVVAGLALAAGLMRPAWLSVMALVVFVLWSTLAATLIARNVPAPGFVAGTQNTAWYLFLGTLASASGLQVVSTVALVLLRWRAARQSRSVAAASSSPA